MKPLPLLAAGAVALLVALAPAPALAHGGSYRGPNGGGSGPGGGQVPPGTADPPAPVTRWETWWASNKEYYLRLATRMRHDENAVTTPKGNGPTAEELRKQEEERRREEDAKVRKQLATVFIEGLTDGSFEVRTAAAIALGKSQDPRGVAPLLKAARKDAHKDVRDSAVLGLGLLGREEALLFLDKVLSSPKESGRYRSFAAFSMGLIGGPDAGAALLRFVDPKMGPKFSGGSRRQPELMASTFIALGLSGAEEAVPVLRDALDSKEYDDGVKSFIVLSLGRAKDRGSLARLVKMAKRHADAGMRRSSVIAIGKIAKGDDKDAVDMLLDAVRRDRDSVTRHFAAVALGQIADDAIRKRLRKMLAKADGIDRPFVALALGLAKDVASAPALRKALEDEGHESTRASYAISLALMNDQDSIDLLEQQLEYRGKQWLRGYSAIALAMLGSKRSAPKLRDGIEETNDPRLKMNFSVALGLLHDPVARRSLVASVKSQDGSLYERGSAAMALGVLRMNAAVPDLLAVYEDRKEQDLVRAFTMVALGVLADPADVPKLARFAIDNNYAMSTNVDPLNEVLSIL